MGCNATEIEKNAEYVENNRPGKVYVAVSVTIANVDSSGSVPLVDFYAPTVASKGLYSKLISGVSLDLNNVDIWYKCPSTLPDPITKGASGVLYIETGVATDNDLLGTPKWPDRLPLVTPFEKVRVWPTRVLVSGYQLHDGQFSFGTVNLLNPYHAATIQNSPPLIATGRGRTEPPQQLVLDGGAVTLSLTDAGLSDVFGLTPSHLSAAVATIDEGADAASMVEAWSVVAAWEEASRTRPDMVTAEARQLLRRVLRRSAL